MMFVICRELVYASSLVRRRYVVVSLRWRRQSCMY